MSNAKPYPIHSVFCLMSSIDKLTSVTPTPAEPFPLISCIRFCQRPFPLAGTQHIHYSAVQEPFIAHYISPAPVPQLQFALIDMELIKTDVSNNNNVIPVRIIINCGAFNGIRPPLCLSYLPVHSRPLSHSISVCDVRVLHGNSGNS